MTDIYSDAQITIEVLRDLGSFANNSYLLRPANGGAGDSACDSESA